MKKLISQGLEYLSPDLIERNPENPRIVFDERLMQELKESINEVGILVPLIVYYDDKKGKYVLLDGERRLKCARALSLKSVPANIVAKPSRLQNILKMFNIHNVRIEWGPMEIAWKLEVIMDDFKYEKEKDLVRLTSLKPAEIRKAKILLSYDKKYQGLVHKGPREGGIKEDFLIELKSTLSWLEKNLSFSKKNINKFIDILIEKHRKEIIRNYVKNFRDLNKIVKSGTPKEKVEIIIRRIIDDPNFSIEEAYEDSIRYSVTAKEIGNRAKRLISLLVDFKFIEKNDENTGLLAVLKKLKEVIEKIINK